MTEPNKLPVGERQNGTATPESVQPGSLDGTVGENIAGAVIDATPGWGMNASRPGEATVGSPIGGGTGNTSVSSPTTQQPPVTSSPGHPLDSHPAVQKASVLHRVAETLAGGPQTKTTFNPMTGEVTREKVPLSNKQILMGALANILGTIGNAAEGFSAGLQRRAPRAAQPLPTFAADQQRAQQSEEDFNRQQNMRVRQAKVMTANLEAMRTAYALGKENDDAKDSVVQNHAGDLENWQKSGAVEASNVPSNELLKKGFDKTKYVAIPDGRVPVFNSDGTRVTDENGVPLSQLTYSVVDGTTQAPLSQDKYNQLAKYGLMQARTGFNLPEGATISSAQLALMNHRLDLINQTQRELDEVHDAVGGEKVDLAAQIKKNPQLLSAIEKFHNDGASTEPDNQVASISGKYPQAAGLMRELFGNENLEKFKENRLARTKAEATSQEEAARLKAKAATPEGQADLQEKQLRIQKLQKDLADKGGIDMSKVQTNVLDGVTPVPDPHYRVNQDVLNKINEQDPGMAASVKAIGEARELMTPQAQRTKDGQAIMKYVNLAYPDYNAAKVDSYFKGRQTGTSGTLGNKVNSFATAMDHLQRYYDNINAISATAGVGTIAAMLGNEKAKAFETDKTALASEIATAYKQGVPSKEEIDKWEKSLGGGTAAASKNGAVETAKLLHGKFSEYANQFRNMIPGGLRDDNFQLMSDNAAKAYQHVTGIKIGSTQPFTQGQNPPQGGSPQSGQRVVPAGGSPVTVNGQVTGYVVNGKYQAFGQ